MTDQIIDDTNADDVNDTTEQPGINRRRMFIAGAGLAGAAALAKAGTASAADGEPVLVGGEYDADSATAFSIAGDAPIAGDLNAVRGSVTSATNGSHAISGSTAGDGHAVSGTSSKLDNGRASTWGKHAGAGAGVGGENDATDIDIAGPARGVEGIVLQATNGSHAVYGLTNGGGHAVAGDVPADAPNTVAATWGRHAGQGAGIGGVNVTETSPLAGPARGVEGVVTSPTNGSHAVFGATSGAGHSVAGDTPADAEDGSGGPNTTAATWGRHGGVGAGIGGISAEGYGGEFVGGKASARLIPSADVAVGPPADDMHLVGELFVDGEGDLYYNTADGANFTKLNGQGGTVLLTDIQRAYDSRDGEEPDNSNKGRHTAGETRLIDLTEFTDFPADASGAIINVTVADTTGNGYALVFNGDSVTDPTPVGSSVNWVGSGNYVANGITVATGAAGTVNVFTLEATEVIIDVVGYIS